MSSCELPPRTKLGWARFFVRMLLGMMWLTIRHPYFWIEMIRFARQAPKEPESELPPDAFTKHWNSFHENLLQRRPNDTIFRAMLIDSYNSSGQFEKAIDECNKTLELREGKRSPMTHYRMAFAYHGLKNWGAVKEQCQVFLQELKPRQRKRLKEEVDWATDYIRSRETNDRARFQHREGLELFDRNAYPAAIPKLKESCARNPDPVGYEYLAYSYYKVGDRDKAYETYEKAKELALERDGDLYKGVIERSSEYLQRHEAPGFDE